MGKKKQINNWDDEHISLCLHGHWLMWTWNGKVSWIPYPIAHVIATCFNWVTCRLLGHYRIGEISEERLYEGRVQKVIVQPDTCGGCNKVFEEQE